MAYLGGVIADPVIATDGDAWVRTDLPQPELRVWVDGAPVTLAVAGIVADVNAALTAHGGVTTAVHGIMDTANLVAFNPVACSVSLPAGGNLVLTDDNDDGGAVTAPKGVFGQVAVDAEGIALKQEGGAVVFDTLAGYGKYRQFVGRLAPSNPAFTELDWQYRVAAFNWTWDPETGAHAKEEEGDAAFQMVFESEWENHVEWNLDLTTRGDNLSHRRLGFFYDKDTGSASWRLATTDGIAFTVGNGDEGLASFETDAGTSKSLCLQARSNNLGYARTQAVNRAGNIVASVITPDTGSGTIFGLPAVNLGMVYSDVQLAVGTSTAKALNFVTNSAVCGGITPAGVWCVGSMDTSNAAAGEVLIGAGKRFSSRTSSPAVAAPLLGLDASDRTVLYLQGKPLSLQGAATAATSGAALGFIKALVDGVAVKIPYFADV